MPQGRRIMLGSREREVAMLGNIKSVLVGLTEEGEPHEPSSALAYGLSAAQRARAHLTLRTPGGQHPPVHSSVEQDG